MGVGESYSVELSKRCKANKNNNPIEFGSLTVEVLIVYVAGLKNRACSDPMTSPLSLPTCALSIMFRLFDWRADAIMLLVRRATTA